VVVGPAEAAIHAVGIIVHPLPLAVRSGRGIFIARWLTSGSARSSRVCDIPGRKISPANGPVIIRAFRMVSDVTGSLAAGTKKMSGRRRKRPGDREVWSTC
jgi:hypothetical protein